MGKYKPNIQRIGDIEIEQDLDFQRREWRVQRIAWVIMLLVVLAAMAGLFGAYGPLTDSVARAEGGQFEVHYGRFERFMSPAELRIRLDGRAVTASEVDVWVDQAYLTGLQIEQISPQPKRTRAGDGRLLYTFEAGRAGQPLEVTFNVTTRQVGLLHGRMGLPGGPEVRYQQFVYP